MAPSDRDSRSRDEFSKIGDGSNTETEGICLRWSLDLSLSLDVNFFCFRSFKDEFEVVLETEVGGFFMVVDFLAGLLTNFNVDSGGGKAIHTSNRAVVDGVGAVSISDGFDAKSVLFHRKKF